MSDISEEWIKTYVDTLLAFAGRLPEGSAMRTQALMRADHVMDLVKAWREKQARDATTARP